MSDSKINKLSRKELEQIKERYELVLEGSEAGIWDYNIITDTAYFSDRFKELMGYSPDELKNLTAAESFSYLHPDFQEKAPQALQEHLEGRAPYYSLDYKVRMKSGEYRWFQARAKAKWGEDGQPINVAGSFIDIHERKTAEEELIKNERLFRNIMDQSPLAIELLSPEGKIERYNPGWLELWGVNKEEAQEFITNYSKLADPQILKQGLMDQVKKAFDGETVILPPIQCHLVQPIEKEALDGVPWIQCYLYPIKDQTGNILNVVNTYMDVTTLKETREELQKEREMLAKIDRSSRMGQLTGSIAHEINQPLTGILSNAQAAELLLKNNASTEKDLREIIEVIVSDTKRASNVIKSLREMYREHIGEKYPFEINEIIEQTTLLLNSEFISNKINLTKKLSRSIPVIEGNVVQIQQVLVNLLMNAVHATSSLDQNDRKIHISSIIKNNEVKIWVEDNGPGIDPGKIDKIFEPLATWKSGGMGMGLAVSNSIIEAHGGNMWAENLTTGCRVGFILFVANQKNKS